MSTFDFGAVEAGGSLDMSEWAIHLAGEEGYALEKSMGPWSAGLLIHRESGCRIPNFYANNTDAMRALREDAAAESK